MISKIIIIGFLLVSTTAWPAPSKRDLIEAIATPLSEDAVMYRWQSKVSGDKLIEEKIFTDKLYSYFMAMKIDREHFAAGKGIYASENPHSSSRFVRGDDKGSLIEVRISKGTKAIDLSDSAVLAKLKANGLSKDDVLFGEPQARVAVKYDAEEKWWVLKGQSGVTFRAFDGSNLKTSYLLNIFSRLDGNKPKLIYAQNVLSTLFKSVQETPSLLKREEVLQLLGKENVKVILLDLTKKATDRAAYLRTLDLIKSSPALNRLTEEKGPLRAALASGRTNYLNMADELASLQNASDRAKKDLILNRLEAIKDEAKYITELEGLAPLVKQNPKLLLEVGAASLRPRGFSPSPRAEEKLAKLRLPVETLGNIVDETPIASSIDQELVNRIKTYVTDWKYPTDLTTDLLGKGEELNRRAISLKETINEITNTPWARRSEKIEAILPKIKNPDDLIYLHLTADYETKKIISKTLSNKTGEIFAASPTIAQIKAISKLLPTKSALAFLGDAFARAKSGDDVLSLARSYGDIALEDHSKMLRSKTKEIFAANPSIEEIKAISELMYTDSERLAFLGDAMARAKSGDDVLTLAQNNSSYDPDKNRAFSKMLKNETKNILLANPTPPQVKEISDLMVVEKDALAFLEAAIARAKTSTEIFAMIDSDLRAHNYDYREGLKKMLKRNQGAFLATRPTAVEAARMAKMIGVPSLVAPVNFVSGCATFFGKLLGR
jgi:hypothetical protein